MSNLVRATSGATAPLPRWLLGSGVGAVATAVLTLPKLVFDAYIGEPTPFLLYFGPVLLAAYFGGYAAGLITTVVASVVSVWLFMPVGAGALAIAPKLALFVVEGISITLVTGRLWIERQRAQRSFAEAESLRERLDLVMAGVDEGITLQDGRGALLYANDLAAKLSGCRSAEEMLATPPAELLQRFEMLDVDGNPFPWDQLPGRRAAQGLDVPEVLIRFRPRGGRESRWSSVRATAIRGPQGETRFVVNLFRDVTELRQNEEALQVAREWFQIALRSIGDAVIATDDQGAVNLLNPVAEELTGWSNSDAQGRSLAEVFRIVREDTREPAESPVDRVLREGVVVGLANHTLLLRRDGSECAIDDSAAPIRDGSGRLRGVILVFRDVSAKRAAEQRRAFLARATEELTSSLDYNVTLATVARMAVPSVADWCAVDIRREDGEIERLAVAHVDESKVERVREMQRRYPSDPNARQGVHQILRTGKPELMKLIPPELLRAAARDEEHGRFIEELGLHSYVAVPLLREGKPFGVLTLVMAESKRSYTEEDLEVALALADRASVAVENASLYRQAESARLEALQANQAKDDFLAMLGHELRNPLAPIRTALQLIELRSNDPHESEHRVIKRQVEHLVRLVDDLLDVSRITHGRLALNRKVVALEAVVRHAQELVWPSAADRRHHVHVAVDPEATVSCDEVRLVQVLVNLLSNAVKYTEPGGNIWVTVRRESDRVVLSVRDDGIGIEPEMQRRVFEMFVQEPQTLDRSRGGLGLGLAIVRGVVLAHGGTVTAHSEGVGKGSEFSIELPLHAPSEEPTEAPLNSTNHESTPAARILVVDDNADGAEMLGLLLEQMGHAVFVATNARDALRIASEQRPTLALLDIGLPEMSGYELGKRLRELEGLSSLKLAAVTGYGQAQDHELSRGAGFRAHLVKPVKMELLVEVIAALSQ